MKRIIDPVKIATVVISFLAGSFTLYKNYHLSDPAVKIDLVRVGPEVETARKIIGRIGYDRLTKDQAAYNFEKTPVLAPESAYTSFVWVDVLRRDCSLSRFDLDLNRSDGITTSLDTTATARDILSFGKFLLVVPFRVNKDELVGPASLTVVMVFQCGTVTESIASQALVVNIGEQQN